MPLPTLTEVLALPAVRAGLPTVLTPGSSLERPVRWVHVSELKDIASLLQGGELILTTGIALPTSDTDLEEYIRRLAQAGASGLMIEIGRRFARIPHSIVQACRRSDLPLITLRREVRFVDITEAIHGRIVQDQFTALQWSERAHKTFTALSLEGADTGDVVSAASRMIGEPVVYEDLMHRVLAFDPASGTIDDLLRNWERRSRRVASEFDRTGIDHHFGWVVAGVEAQGERFGRLIMVCAGEASAEQTMVLERAATAITMTRLLELNRETVERQALRSTLNDIIDKRYPTEASMHARTGALGVPTADRALVALAVDAAQEDIDVRRPGGRDMWDRVVAAAKKAGTPALVAPLRGRRIGVLVSLAQDIDRTTVLDTLAGNIHQAVDSPVIIGVGSTAHRIDDVARVFAEAEHVASSSPHKGSKPYYEMPDTQLQGLLYVLGNDPRLQSYVERTLRPLMVYDDHHGTDLLSLLATFLDQGGNKKAAATTSNLSRQGLYEKLALIERTLETDLRSAEARTGLHVAVLALRTIGRDR